MSSTPNPLLGRTVLVTGAARRLGRSMALAAAQAGADIILHHSSSPEAVQETSKLVHELGRKSWIIQADFGNPQQVSEFCASVFSLTKVDAVVNSAAIFKPVDVFSTSLDDWNKHIQVNLTAPFQISQYFAQHFSSTPPGRIINILDWRALKPGKDHFPYTISKAGLTAMTQSLALSLAPTILVNGIALGAMLPPENEKPPEDLINKVPLKRWANLEELEELLVFLLSKATYTTGEIIHLDGGRHLV